MSQTTIRKPGEKLVRTITSSVMGVEVYETYVVKRLDRHAGAGPEVLAAMHRAVEAHQAAAADGVPGVLRCEGDPERGVVEEFAPGAALDVLDPPLTPEEIVRVYHETIRTAKALREYGIYLRRRNPQNTWLDRETGQVVQIDLHHPSDLEPESRSEEALPGNVVSMLARGVVYARIVADGEPQLGDMASETFSAYSRARDVYERMQTIKAYHGPVAAKCLQSEWDEAYLEADATLRRLEAEKARREDLAKRLEPSISALLEQDAKGEPLQWEEPAP